MFTFFKALLSRANPQKESSDMKYLIVGLGNIGDEYENTRHNIGFNILNELASAHNVSFKEGRYGEMAHVKHKARTFILLKPNTYVNLSGKAINYWIQREKIKLSNLLVVVDDLALPFGSIRLKGKGGDAGHNGLKSIQAILGTTNYARLRFGIGDEYEQGRQVDFVLGKWSTEEKKTLSDRINISCDTIKAFGTIGLGQTMNQFNKK